MSYSLFINNSYIHIYIYIYTHTTIKGLPLLGSSFFLFKNAPTPLFLSKDKTKEQCDKYTTLTPTKTFPKK